MASSAEDNPDAIDDGMEEEEEEDGKSQMGYQQTLMYGRYSRSLGDIAKEEAKKRKVEERRMARNRRKISVDIVEKTPRGKIYTQTAKGVTWVWKHSFAKVGEDWVFLAFLGIVMAVISFGMDFGIEVCGHSRMWLYQHMGGTSVVAQYFSWIILPIVLVLFSAGFVHLMSPQAIGSGIPEMKTILRGVVLPEYLSGKTLIAKIVGLTCTLGSGMPLGKEGPFVHIASIVATLLSKLVTSFQGIYTNESRQFEMLAAACAVGVACCFGSPIGGVLFSIEVTSVYFAVRNYWRGFFAAVFGAMSFRLLSIWFNYEDTIVPLFGTGFEMEFPYDPKELFIFALIGLFSGLGGAFWVFLHRRYVLWMRGNKRLNSFLQKNRFIYPTLVAWFISTLSFPPWIGQFHAAEIGTHKQVKILFANETWTIPFEDMTVDEWSHVKHFITPYSGLFVNLFVYMLMTFFLSILASTLPVPTGVLIPSFKVGAAFGRMVGEGMHLWFPNGIRHGDYTSYIYPGGYATVGAAAFTGAVTHTISISMIVFEMTGQITHCVPILIAVLVSNAIAALLQPSCYDSIIMIKKLPYLPDILPASSGAYDMYVEDFMIRHIKYIWYGMTYRQLRDMLREAKNFQGLPIVDNSVHMILLGSIRRTELIGAIEKHIGQKRRLEEALRRYEKAAEMQKQQEEVRRMEKQRELQFKLEEEARIRKEKEVAMTKARPQRRPSRFEVTTEGGVKFVPDSHNSETVSETSSDDMRDSPPAVPAWIKDPNLDPNSPALRALQQLSSKPKKSILKKSNSYTIHGFSDTNYLPSRGISPELGKSYNDLNKRRVATLPKKIIPEEGQASIGFKYQADMPPSPDQSVTGAESRLKATFSNLFKKPSQLNLARDSPDSVSPGPRRPFRVDMSSEEQRAWEEEQLDLPVDFNETHIDPAPFQLVEKTSLLKVHSLFSMLGVNRAYVTATGRLIGIVGLQELRKAIEDANSGHSAHKQAQKIARKLPSKSVPANKSHPSLQITVDSNASSFRSEDEEWEYRRFLRK